MLLITQNTPRSLTELLVTLIPHCWSGTKLTENQSKETLTWKAGKEHCLQENPHVPAARAGTRLGWSTSPDPTEQELLQVHPSHSHASAHGENTRTAKLGSDRLERATDTPASSSRFGSAGSGVWQLCRQQEACTAAARHCRKGQVKHH